MNDIQKNKKIWTIFVCSGTLFCCLVVSVITYIVDPFFHFHYPNKLFKYKLVNERYVNDGIIRNFTYDAIITGTSMTENFYKTECDQIFNCNSIKVPFSGATYKEINDNLERAFTYNDSIKLVIRCLDYTSLVKEPSEMRIDAEFPYYLYNNNALDDVNYFLNKNIFISYTLNTILYTKMGGNTTTFDEYVNWNSESDFGKDAVLNSYSIEKCNNKIERLSDSEKELVRKNITENVTDLVDEHQETVFYLFFPPYSICYYGELFSQGRIGWQIEAEKVAIEELLKHDNIRLFSFSDDFDDITNLDNYRDTIHYGEWINSKILNSMKQDRGRLTLDNYEEYINRIEKFYSEYDYSSLYRDGGVK